jgi:hypothetical protein
MISHDEQHFKNIEFFFTNNPEMARKSMINDFSLILFRN